MGQTITIGFAAELMGCTSRSVLRQAAASRLRAVPSPGRRAGRRKTMIDVDSLPWEAQRAWREKLRLSPVTALAPAPVSEPASESCPSDKLPMARFRYALIEPLLTGEWARVDEMNGVTVRKRDDYVQALAAGKYRQPDGTEVSYSASGVYLLLRRFRDGGLAALATRTRSDRGTTRLPRIVQDFILAAYCSGGSRLHPELRSLREVMRLLDEERTKRTAMYGTSEPKGVRLLDYIHGRSEFAALTESGRGWAQYATDDGEPQAAEFYLLPEVSYGAARRYVESVPEPLKELSRRGLEAYKNNCERTIVRDYAALHCMQYVVFDHRRCDVFVRLKRHGKYVVVRPWETVALDMRSRCVLASVMSVVPSSLTIASCIRAVVLRWGLFETAYFDNGKDFRSQYIDGDGAHDGASWRQDWKSSEFADTRGVLARLGVEVVHAIPYSGRSKPIEPSFRNPANFERTLAGACGNRPHNRPEATEEMVAEFNRWSAGTSNDQPFMDWDKFRALKEWFYYEKYNREPHSGREMKGRSPEQAIREEYADKGLARMVDARALDLLMQKRRLRTVGNGGTFVVSFGGQDYVYTAPELWLLQARQLETGYDPEDLGEMVVYEPGGKYVCTARCTELRRMGEEQFRQDIAEQRRLVKQTRQAAEHIQRMVALPTPEERMAWSRASMPEPLTLAGAPATAQLEERFEQAARAERITPEPDNQEEDAELTFLGT